MKTLDVMSVTCSECNGRMFIDEQLCGACDGEGRLVIPFAKSSRKSTVWLAVRILAEVALATVVIILMVMAIAAIAAL